jgi:hypothetical protein
VVFLVFGVSVPLVAIVFIKDVGSTFTGVAAKSIAVAIHSNIGSLIADSVFAFFIQSAAM